MEGLTQTESNQLSMSYLTTRGERSYKANEYRLAEKYFKMALCIASANEELVREKPFLYLNLALNAVAMHKSGKKDFDDLKQIISETILSCRGTFGQTDERTIGVHFNLVYALIKFHKRYEAALIAIEGFRGAIEGGRDPNKLDRLFSDVSRWYAEANDSIGFLEIIAKLKELGIYFNDLTNE